MSKPSITVYTVAYNESFLLPQINKWWHDRFSDVRFELYDNYSDDDTPNMALDLGWKVNQFDTGGKMSDLVHMNLKNKCWKSCETEYAWICDFDEVPGFDEELILKHDFNVAHCVGYETIDAAYTIEEACYAIQNGGYSKMALIKPAEIQQMNYEAGAHKGHPETKVGFNLKINSTDFPLLHMKWFNPTHAIKRAMLLGQKQSDDNIKRKWSFHFGLPLEDHLNYYKTHFANRMKIREVGGLNLII